MNPGDAEEQVEYFPSPSITDDPEAPAAEAAVPEPVAAEAPEAAAPVEVPSADPTLWPEGHPRDQERRGKDAERGAPAKKDQGRYEYHQARADRAEAEAKLLKQQLAQLKAPKAPAPEAEAPVVPPAPVAPALEKPKPPVKPDRYDKVEAYADPASESFKHREAMEQYRDAMIDYQEKREALREQQVQRQTQEWQIQEQRRQQVSQLQASLQAQFKMTPQEAIDFIQTMSSPESVSVPNLVALYRLMRGNKQPTNLRQQELLERQARGSTPSPAGLIGTEQDNDVTEEDGFNLGLMKYSKKVRKDQ